MEMWIVPIAVAIITGPIVVLMSRFDKRNTAQHDQNMEELLRIGRSVESVDNKVERMDGRLDRHIEWHVEQEDR